MTDIPKDIGATGKFPDGKIDETDEGELALAVGYDPKDGMVKVEFGKPVAWLAMRPSDAIALGQSLIRNGQRGQSNIIPNRIIRPQ